VKGFSASRLQVTFDVMMARPDNLIAQARAHVATAMPAIARATLAMSMSLLTAGTAWPQATSPPPALGVQEPAQQASPQQASPSEVRPHRHLPRRRAKTTRA
jgi:hypothetical protein